MVKVPFVGLSRHPIMLMSVVLPDPDGPTNDVNDPRFISRETLLSAETFSSPRVYILLICSKRVSTTVLISKYNIIG